MGVGGCPKRWWLLRRSLVEHRDSGKNCLLVNQKFCTLLYRLLSQRRTAWAYCIWVTFAAIQRKRSVSTQKWIHEGVRNEKVSTTQHVARSFKRAKGKNSCFQIKPDTCGWGLLTYWCLDVKGASTQNWLAAFVFQCPIEWFHFPCVGLTSKPKGKWFVDISYPFSNIIFCSPSWWRFLKYVRFFY